MTCVIYCDGSCIKNPGPGGWAFWAKRHGAEATRSGGFTYTTNNRMELLAAAEALEYVQCDCIIHTDSRYVEQGITEWIGKWKQNRWRTSMGKPVKNMDLWQKLDELAKEYTIEWKWVKGHSGIVMHDKIDRLARDMAREYGEKADSTRSQL